MDKVLRCMGLLCLMCIVVLVSCTPKPRKPLKVVSRDSGAMIELCVGDQIELVLDANPSTGYQWEVVEGGHVMQQAGEPEFKPDSPALGAGGKVTMSFKAVAVGEERLRLAYRRSWEEGVAPEATFELYIVVK